MIVDSQSTKTALGGEQIGYDGFKKVKGRKRHILADVLGLLWAVKITAANLTDGQQLVPLVNSLEPGHDRLEKILADGAYGIRNHPEQFEEAFGKRLELEISSRPPDQRSFVPAKIRWIVERCFAWLGNSRRLSKDYERTVASSKAFVQIASLRRAFTLIQSPS
jgi:putative transposase